jgi:hypothetical protein
MESVEANKNDLKFDYNRMEIPDLKNTMESIMNNLSSDDHNENKDEQVKSSIDEIIEEKEKQLSEMSKASSKSTEVLISSEKDSAKSNQIGFTNNKKSEQESDSKSKELDEKTLNNMKLPEIKKIAEKNKITITKKVNGQQKPKNKNELETEIINKLAEKKL